MFRYLVGAGALAAMMGTAQAAPKCAPGEFYRVSKKVCVDREIAVRQGLAAPIDRQARLKEAAARRAERLSREPAPLPPRRDASANEPAGITIITASAKQPQGVFPRPARHLIAGPPSPFGALLDPWASDKSIAPSPTLFSLRMSVEE